MQFKRRLLFLLVLFICTEQIAALLAFDPLGFVVVELQ